MFSISRRLLLFALLIGFVVDVHAQTTGHSHGRVMNFPDVPGYFTLKTDFHQHTVFSDGQVWPSIRAEEAIRDGLDAISLTEHLEYQPHRDDIPHPDRNRAFEIATSVAEGSDLIVIRGSEITRSMPPGHSNAIFIEDANALLQDDPMPVFEEASRQKAFVFWNHPNWTAQRSDGVATLTDMHQELIDKNLMHGIEVVNELTYSDEALQIALDHNLTIMGTSDIHGLVDWLFEVPQGGHRPITLVFAKERSAESIREALFAGRTVVYFNDLLVGREEHLGPLLSASLVVREASYLGDSSVLRVQIENQSDVPFILERQVDMTFHQHGDVLIVEDGESVFLDVKTIDRKRNVELQFEVLNAITAPNEHPVLSLPVSVGN